MFWQTTNIWVAVCFACGDVWNEFAPPPIGELPRTLDTSGSSQLSFWANDYGHHPARSGKPVLNIYLFSHWYHVPEPDYEVCPWSFGDRKSTVKSLPTMHHCPSFPGKRSTLVSKSWRRPVLHPKCLSSLPLQEIEFTLAVPAAQGHVYRHLCHIHMWYLSPAPFSADTLIPDFCIKKHKILDFSTKTYQFSIFWHQAKNFDTCTACGACDKYQVWSYYILVILSYLDENEIDYEPQIFEWLQRKEIATIPQRCQNASTVPCLSLLPQHHTPLWKPWQSLGHWVPPGRGRSPWQVPPLSPSPSPPPFPGPPPLVSPPVWVKTELDAKLLELYLFMLLGLECASSESLKWFSSSTNRSHSVSSKSGKVKMSSLIFFFSPTFFTPNSEHLSKSWLCKGRYCLSIVSLFLPITLNLAFLLSTSAFTSATIPSHSSFPISPLHSSSSSSSPLKQRSKWPILLPDF